MEVQKPLSVIVSCDTAGWIVPCGCSAKQAGGLLRRATYVNGVRRNADVVTLDAGGAPGGTSPYEKAKFAAILQGEVEMQVAAHNLGAAELDLGADTLKRLAQQTHIPFVSSNVLHEDGTEVVPARRDIVVGERRLVVLGVVSPQLVKGPWKVAEPREALLRLLRKDKKKSDVICVLAYLPEEELAELAAHLPEADLVIGGPTLQSVPPGKSGPTSWAAVTNKGKFLVRFTQNDSQGAWEGKIIELGPELPDDQQQAANLTRFREHLEKIDFTSAQTGFAPQLPPDAPQDFQIAGTAACQKCHPADCSAWEGSRHGSAWQTLVDKKSYADPYCQHCHTTGYGLPEGFLSLASQKTRGNVGCESCHGPAFAHASNPKQSKTLYAARDQCVACHDLENSPQFAYDKYWTLIKHGEPAKAHPVKASKEH